MKNRIHNQFPFAVAGLGCLIGFILVALLGQLSFADFNLAFANQLPLTISGDAGCVIGLVIIALTRAIGIRGNLAYGYAAAFASAGLCMAALVRSGIILGSNSQTLVAGDVLTGLFTTLGVFCWWRIYSSWDETKALHRLALALVTGSAIFLLLALIPQRISCLLFCIVLPFGSCLCFLPFILSAATRSISDDELGQKGNRGTEEVRDDSRETVARRFPPLVAIATVALACFVVDFGMDLFPICLYHEPSPVLASIASAPESTNAPIGTLTQPAAICALLIIVLSVLLAAFTRGKTMPLFPLYLAGFALTAFDYLAFPYHLVGGLPLGAAEAGRIAIAVFVVAVMLRMLEDENGEGFGTRVFLVMGFAAFAVMLAADAIAIIVQMQPGFDYTDFRFRTVFAGIGTAFLIALILGPLPRLDKAIAPSPAESPGESGREEPTLEERFEHVCASFAADHGLSARETEVFTLIANGRDVPYIERELVLAKSTVKTHIKHIYEKCGVSSRQDLLDKFEEYRNGE